MPSSYPGSTLALFPNLNTTLRQLGLLFVCGDAQRSNPNFLTENEVRMLMESPIKGPFYSSVMQMVSVDRARIRIMEITAQLNLQRQTITKRAEALLEYEDELEESEEYKQFREALELIAQQQEELDQELEELEEQREQLEEEFSDVSTPIQTIFEQRAEALAISGIEPEIQSSVDQMIDDVVDALVASGTIATSEKDQAKTHLKKKVRSSQVLSQQLSVDAEELAEHHVTSELVDQNLAQDTHGIAQHAQSHLKFRTAVLIAMVRHKIVHNESFTQEAAEPELNITYQPTLKPEPTQTSVTLDTDPEATQALQPEPQPTIDNKTTTTPQFVQVQPTEDQLNLFQVVQSAMAKSRPHALSRIQACVQKAITHMESLTSKTANTQTPDLSQKTSELAQKAKDYMNKVTEQASKVQTLNSDIKLNITEPAQGLMQHIQSRNNASSGEEQPGMDAGAGGY